MRETHSVATIILDRSEELRRALAEELAREADMEVAEVVADPVRLLTSLEKRHVDVVILDVSVPGAVGTLNDMRKLSRAHPDRPEMGVVLVARRTSADAALAIEGLEAGAFDVVLRPGTTDLESSVASLARQLRVKVRHFSSKRLISSMPGDERRPGPVEASVPIAKRTTRFRAVLVGGSTGAPKVLAHILPEICEATTLPVLIAQHMPEKFTSFLAASLDGKCRHKAAEAVHGEPLEPGRIYVAPGGKHLSLEFGTPSPTLAVNDEPPINGFRPSVDYLFASAAKVLGRDVLALILTGMGNDGLSGTYEIKGAGGCVVAQDEATSVVWGMPGAVANAGLADRVLDYKEIAGTVNGLVGGR